MAFQDCYELVDESTLYGQKVLNVYFYQNNNVLNGGATASDLIDGFLAEVMPAIRAIQVSGVVHTEVRARNLFNEADRHVRTVSLAGTSAETDGYSGFTAAGFTLVQDNGAIRNGGKRYAGMGEGYATNGVIDNGGAITLLNALGAAVEQNINILAAEVFRPVVIKRLLVAGGYVLPGSLGEAVIGGLIDVVWNTLVTSQVSRKIGNGE